MIEKQFILIIILIIFAIPKTNAQSSSVCRISGTFIDSLTHKPVEYANFILISLRDRNKAIGAVSDSIGHFELKNILPGQYEARISCMGYKSRKRKNFNILDTISTISIDTIYLIQKYLTYGDVTITAEKKPIVYEDDKIIYNIKPGMGNNAMDLLENAPLVSVGIDGSISLLGNKTEIYIDGQPASVYGIEKPEDLKEISFYEIERFDIYTDPTSQFPGRKMGGVINIVMKKKNGNGYSANIGSEFTTNNTYSVNTGISFRYNNLLVNSTYYNTYLKNKTSGVADKSTIYNDLSVLSRQKFANTKNMASNNLRGYIAYTPEKFNIYNCLVSYKNIFTRNDNDLDNQYLTENTKGFRSRKVTGNMQNLMNSMVSYTRLFEEKEKSFNALVSYFNNDLNINNNYENESILTDNGYDDNIIKNKIASDNVNKNYTWQVKYSFPIRSINTNMMIKHQGSFKRLSMNSNYYSISAENGLSHLNDIISSNDDNVEVGLYTGADGKYSSLRYSAGISFNQYSSKINDGTSNTRYNKLTIEPSMDIFYRINKFQKFGAGYSLIRQNPMNKQLNPYRDNSDSTSIISGNTSLRPTSINFANLYYENIFGESYFRVTTQYSYAFDIIELVTRPITPYVSHTTYMNAANMQVFSVNISGTKKIFGLLELEPRLGYSISRYSGNDMESKSSSWSSMLKARFFMSTLKLQTDLNYQSPSSSMQIKNKGQFSCNAAVRAVLFDKNLSLSLKVTDLFNTVNNNYDIIGASISQNNRIHKISRTVTLNISYFFRGKAPDKFDDQSINVEEEDDF